MVLDLLTVEQVSGPYRAMFGFRSLEQMIAAAALEYIDPEMGESDFRMLIKRGHIRNLVVIHPKRPVSTDEVLDIMLANDWEPLDLPYLLALSEINPDLQREGPIVALGSVDEIGGEHRVPYIGTFQGRRSLQLGWADHDWSESWRFGAHVINLRSFLSSR